MARADPDSICDILKIYLMVIIPGNIILALLCIAGKISCFSGICYQLCKFIDRSLIQLDHLFHCLTLIDLIDQIVTETISICRRYASRNGLSGSHGRCYNGQISLIIKILLGKNSCFFQKACRPLINIFNISLSDTIHHIAFFHVCMMIGCLIRFIQFNTDRIVLLPELFFLDEIVFFHKIVRLDILSFQKLIQKAYEIQHSVQCHFVRMTFFLH